MLHATPTSQTAPAITTSDPAVTDAPRTAVVRLLPGEIADVPAAYTTRRVDVSRAVALETTGVPRSGDLVLAEVTEIGQHTRLENGHGRRIPLTPGDHVIVAFGARYAPDQFEAVVPADLGPCQLVAGGGLAAHVRSQHASVRDATSLQPLGLLLDADGRRLSTADGALPPIETESAPLVLVVVGSSMNSGKTTTAQMAVRGLVGTGMRTGAAKVTGTGSGNDIWKFHDAGARPAIDFTDLGHPSTWQVPVPRLVEVLEQSIAHLAAAGCEVVVIEIADGLGQQETAAMLQHPAVRDRIDGLLFAATDALCASAGLAWLRARDLEPLAITGLLSASPLATREFAELEGHPVWDSTLLSDAAHAYSLHAALQSARASRS